MCVPCQRDSFQNYINDNQPIYQGTDQRSNKVTVKLVRSSSKISHGIGEIKPYCNSERIKNSKRDLIYDEPQNKTCYIQVHNRTVNFMEDNGSVFYKLKASRNLEKLEIVSLSTKKNLGTLHLKKTTASRETI